MVRWPSAVTTARGRSRSSVKSSLADCDRVPGPARVEQDVGEQQLSLQPLGIGPRRPRRQTRAEGRPRPSACACRASPASRNSRRNRWSRAAPASENPSIVSLGRAFRAASRYIQCHPDRGRSPRPPGPAGSNWTASFGRLHDLVAITLDQPAVLAEDDHPVRLCHDQVAVARDQVAPLGVIRLLQLDRRLGTQAASLVEDLDLILGRPVDQVAGQEAAAVALERLPESGQACSSLPVLTSKRSTRLPVATSRSLGHSQQVRELDVVGDRIALPEQPAARRVEREDRVGVAGRDEHPAVVDHGRVQVALVASSTQTTDSWRG